MAKYVFFFGGADLDKRTSNAALAPEIYRRFAQWRESLRESGHFVASYKLRDQTGVRLKVRGGQVVEGPFVESKEAVGGLWVVEAESFEAAVDLARSSPVLGPMDGYMEVRVIEEGVSIADP